MRRDGEKRRRRTSSVIGCHGESFNDAALSADSEPVKQDDPGDRRVVFLQDSEEQNKIYLPKIHSNDREFHISERNDMMRNYNGSIERRKDALATPVRALG